MTQRLIEKAMSPHLALTHKQQGGAANKRNVALLLKSGEAVDESIVEIYKAQYYKELRSRIDNVIKQEFGDKDTWIYVDDFNDSTIIFSMKDQMWSVNYTLDESGGVVLSDPLAIPVVEKVTYEPTTGKMKLSEGAEDGLEEGAYTLLKSAVEAGNKTILKQMEGKMTEDVIKAAKAEMETLLKAQFEAEKQALMQEIEVFKKAQKDTMDKVRMDAIKSVECEQDKATALFKAMEGLEQDKFDVVLKALKERTDPVENSPLFKEQGNSGGEATDVVKSKHELEQDALDALIEKTYNK